MDIYQAVLRPVLFSGLKADPEWVHQQSLKTLGWLDQESHRGAAQWLQAWMQQAYEVRDRQLQQSLWSLSFANPVGLAAGFDKDGVASGIWPNFGFGFAELGTVTLQAQPGNPRPRLFRLPLDQAALNRMGFNNQGAAVMAARLQARWGQRQTEVEVVDEQSNAGKLGHNAGSAIPLGINLGKSKVTPLEEAAADYVGSFRLLQDWGDYFVVNVSSPNTPGLRSLQATEQLEPILQGLQQENTQGKPLLIKIAPDLEWEAIGDVISLAQRYQLAGIIATNTTISRTGLKTAAIAATGKPISEEAGGISGAPVRQRSTDVIRFIRKETRGTLPIIGVGGIFTAEDAWQKIIAGASLVQVYTGWVYEGPWMVRRILQGLLHKLQEHGFETISAAVGREDDL